MAEKESKDLSLGPVALVICVALVVIKVIDIFYYTGMICCFLLVSLQMPLWNGYVASTILTRVLLHGHSFKFRSISVFPFLLDDKIGCRITARNITFANPPGYPHENFTECERLEVELEVPFSKWRDIIAWRVSVIPLKKHPEFKCVTVVKVRRIEFDGVMLNFEMWNGRLNINEINRRIANLEMARFLKAANLPSVKRPNCLRVKVVRARNLPKNEHNVFAKDKTCDPRVHVRARDQVHCTAIRFNTREPMWNDASAVCYFPVTDASTVLHVSVCNKDLTLNGFIGQWVMTLKYLFTNPRYNYHNSIEIKRPGYIRGWFPLRSRRFHRMGKCGEIELEIEWFHNDALEQEASSPCTNGAMAQLKQNSNETNLRLGDRERLKEKLNSVPLLFDIDRVTIRNVEVYVKDLFMGKTGHAETLKTAGKSADEANSIQIDLIDFRKLFRPKYGDPGIPCYKVVHRFFAKGLPPMIFEGKILGSALSQSTSGLAHHLNSTLRRLFKGKDLDKNLVNGIQSFGKKVGQDLKSVGLHMKMKSKMLTTSSSSVKRVNALDEEFLLESCTCKGRLEKATAYGKKISLKRNIGALSFKPDYFELKGNVLFYGTDGLSEPRKIRLDDTRRVLLDKDKEHIEIHQAERITFLRVVKCKAQSKDDRKRFSNMLSLKPSRSNNSELTRSRSSPPPSRAMSGMQMLGAATTPSSCHGGLLTLPELDIAEPDATLEEWFQALQSLNLQVNDIT